MRATPLASFFLATFVALPSMADPCSDVVADTLAEMRAGAAVEWSAEIEGLVRRAAGSACVKASSGRYGDGATTDSAATVAPRSSSESMAEAEVVSTNSTPTPAATAAESTKEDDGSWTAGGLTFRSLTGSPAKKPYQRQREQEKALEAQEKAKQESGGDSP